MNGFLELERRTAGPRWWTKFAAILGWVGQRYLWDTIAVEVALFKIHEATETWPDEYVIYPHGLTAIVYGEERSPDDPNPHVWFPIEITYHWGSLEQNAGRITMKDGQCPCGMRQTRWTVEQAGIVTYQNEDAVADFALAMQGVIRRDVQ